MAQEFSVSGSITVKRLRTGATLGLSIRTDKQLVQVVNVDKNTVSPDWSDPANQPTLTPEVIVTPSGATVDIIVNDGQGWWYNSSLLNFSGSEVNGWIDETRDNEDEEPRFSYNPTKHALKIIANLASSDNYASDTLQFVCTVDYEGALYEMSASQVVTIVPGGTTGYQGFVDAETHILNQTITKTTLRATLVNGGDFVSNFSTKWYTGQVASDHVFREEESTTSGVVAITVDRDDVNGGNNNDSNNYTTGGTLFICQFYNDEGTLVATQGVNIVDEADEYSCEMSISADSAASTLDAGPVTVQAVIYSNSAQGIVTNYGTATFSFAVLDADFVRRYSGEVKDPENGIAKYVVQPEYSLDGNDVNVTCDVTFTLKV